MWLTSKYCNISYEKLLKDQWSYRKLFKLFGVKDELPELFWQQNNT